MKERDCLRRLNPTTWIHYKYRYRYRYRYIYIYRPYRYSLWHSGNERDWQRTEPHHLDALWQQDGWTFDFNSEPHATLDGIKGRDQCKVTSVVQLLPLNCLKTKESRRNENEKKKQGGADESKPGLMPLLTFQYADAGSYLCTGWLQSVNADKWANKAMFVCQSILSWRSRKQYKWKQIMI